MSLALKKSMTHIFSVLTLNSTSLRVTSTLESVHALHLYYPECEYVRLCTERWTQIEEVVWMSRTNTY